MGRLLVFRLVAALLAISAQATRAESPPAVAAAPAEGKPIMKSQGELWHLLMPRINKLIGFYGVAERRSDLAAAVTDLRTALASRGHAFVAQPFDNRLCPDGDELGADANVYRLATPDRQSWVDILSFRATADVEKHWRPLRRDIYQLAFGGSVVTFGDMFPDKVVQFNYADSGKSVIYAVFRSGNQMVHVGRSLSVAVPADLDNDSKRSSAERDEILSALAGDLEDLYQLFRTTIEHLVVEQDRSWMPVPDATRLSPEERVAGFIKLWCEVKYNFAYFENAPDVRWEAIRFRYLPRVSRDQSDEEYHRVLQECLALLHDGHTNVELSLPPATAPVRLTTVDGKLIISDVLSNEETRQAGLQPGMEVTQVDGRLVQDVLAKNLYPGISASTPQARERWACGLLLAGKPGTKVEVTVQNADGHARSATLTRVATGRLPWRIRKPLLEYRELHGGIAYVALNSFESDQVVKLFEERLEQIRKGKGLIFDVRSNGGGNSGYGDAIIGRLIDKPLKGTLSKLRQHVGATHAWGWPRDWSDANQNMVEPRGDNPYLGPVVVLIGPDTGSAAEDFLIPLHASGRATLVGGKTSGSTGQPLFVDVPGGVRARICTRHVTYPDGKRFVGVGVIPDVEVYPTREDVAAGRDPVFEKGLAALKEMLASGATGEKATTSGTASLISQ